MKAKKKDKAIKDTSGNELINNWEAPDTSRLTPKQISLRLPVHIAARINALCDMYPQKTKTDIIGDLLGFALDQVQACFPDIKEDNRILIGDEVAPKVRYRTLANQHYMEIEKTLGIDSPLALFPVPDNQIERVLKKENY